MQIRFLLGSLLLLTLLLNTGQGQAASVNGAPLFFPETGHTLAYNFRDFWEHNGGLDIFGYPITEVYLENNRPVQYFERARLEWFGNLALTQGGLLGRWAATEKQDLPAFKPVNSSTGPTATFFPETGHTLDNGFQNFWQMRGGLAIFGFPISEEFQEQNASDGQLYTVQYFERARFEYHPANPLEYHVQLGQLGSQYLEKMHPAPVNALLKATQANTAWDNIRPTNIKIPRLKLDTDVVEGGFSLDVWDVPRFTAVHYWPVSGFPGSDGNIVIAGHAGFVNTIFDHLPQAVLGDEIILMVGNKEKHYKVTEIMTLLPEDNWIMNPTEGETLTLITCVPPGVYNHRLVVLALPIAPPIPA
jgi:LPXTG-site transpeptidase (sortase) family protein